MASAEEPFHIVQFQAQILGILPESSELTLVYMNYRMRDPLIHPSYEIPNIADLGSVRPVVRSIKLIDKSSYKDHFTKGELENLERGHFTIEGMGTLQDGKYESFGTGFVNYMTISINDDLRRNKLSTPLMQGMLDGIRMEGIRNIDQQKLFIDVDASDWFWDKIGMIPNPRGNNFNGPRVEGNGYEKMITIEGIRQYIRSKKMSSQGRASRSNRSSSRGIASRSSRSRSRGRENKSNSQGRRRGGTRKRSNKKRA